MNTVIDKRIDDLLSRHYPPQAPGAVVIVAEAGRLIHRQAYGLADVSRQQALQPAMIFRIGSLSKQFTAAAVMLLIERGLLSLHDDIGRFLPDYPAQGRRITVEHLLNHTSGIPCYTELDEFDELMATPHTVWALIDLFKSAPLQFAPGSGWSYSNSGYCLLGAIIEAVSGQSYASFMAQQVFEPLGMSATAVEGDQPALARVSGYSVEDDVVCEAAPIDMSVPFAAGDLLSNVDDLLRWENAIATGRLLGASAWQKMFSPCQLADGSAGSYGFGFEIQDFQSNRLIDHDGGINGFASYMARVPEQGLFLAILANCDALAPDPLEVGRGILAELLAGDRASQ